MNVRCFAAENDRQSGFGGSLPFRRFKLLVTVLLLLLATVANAQLSRVGPVDPANGFPSWYQDKTGMAMEFCQNQTQPELNGGWCLLLPPDPATAPEVFPSNFFVEHFYWAANSGIRKVTIPGTAKTSVVMLVMALEGSFANNISAVQGDQMVFARMRIKINPLPYDGTYTVYTPFGKFVFDNQLASQPRGIFFTEDVGLSPLAFDQALNGRIGPFLLPSTVPGGPELPPIPDLLPGQDPFYDALVAVGGTTAYPNNGKRYIADPGRIGPITGSPLPDYVVGDGTTRNANIFRIEGPNGWVFESTDFTVMGRLFEGAIAGNLKVERASYARSLSAGNNVDVYATGNPSTKGRLPAQLATPTISTSMGFFDAACTPTLDAAGNPGPPYSAPVGYTATQMFNSGSSYYGQSQPAVLPLEVCVQGNAASAAGQTVTTYYPAELGDQVFISEALYNPVAQSMSVKATSSDQVVPQSLTVEGFGNIDPATGQLVVSTLLAPPEKVTVLSTGRGRNQLQMNTVNAVGASAPPGTPLLPVAVNDSASTLEDTPVTFAVTANDTNAAGATVAVVSAPLLGSAVVNLDGSITYTPNLNANGTDSFTYHLTVGTQISNEASVTITITPVNDPPVAINDTTGALRGVLNTVKVLANDIDPDGAADLASAVIVTGNATLGVTAGTVFPGGVVTFTPSATAPAGPYTFTYNAVDLAGAISATPATVTVNLATTEAIVPAKAIYTQIKGLWVVSGTVSPAEGQTLTVAYADGSYKVNGVCSGSSAGIVVGRAVPDALGNWTYTQTLTSTAGVLNPSNSGGNSAGFWCTPPKSVRITSSLSPASAPFSISLK